jgi:hypothetical protein
MLASTPAEAKAGKRPCIIKIFRVGRGCAVRASFFIWGGRSGFRMMGCPMGGGRMGREMMGDGACQLVEGRISPMGYYDLYAPA